MTYGEDDMPGQKRHRKPAEAFTFTFEGKTFVIRERYDAQAATIYLPDGRALIVRQWLVGVPFQAEPERIEQWDQTQPIQELAAQTHGFVAELQQAPSSAQG
jgi:hypothetical protein